MIINGDLDVAEKKYFAERINFYVPEISLNASTPAYSVDEEFDFPRGLKEKELIKTSSMDLMTNIELKQSLFTGGDITARANLKSNDYQYPLWSDSGIFLRDISQLTKRGFFDFEFHQPILQPSDARNDLNNSRDDLEIARIKKVEDIADLKKEVTESYFGFLQLLLEHDVALSNLKATSLTREIDSIKFVEGVISEEDYLESASNALDMELALFDNENDLSEKKRELIEYLDLGADENIEPVTPPMIEPLDDDEKEKQLSLWPQALSIKKAKYEYEKSKRATDYSASSRGINGDLKATYSFGRGTVSSDASKDDNIKTNSWGLSFNITFLFGMAEQQEPRFRVTVLKRKKPVWNTNESDNLPKL